LLSIIIPVQKIKKEKNRKYFYKPVFGIKDKIQSIGINANIDYELIVVINDYDNKQLIEYISCNKLVKKFVVNSMNPGVSRAWNIGANMAEGNLLCFCNDDVEFSSESFRKCIEVFTLYDRVGQIGPAGGMWNLDRSGKRVGLTCIEDADEISGFFFILKREVYDMAGGFDITYTPAGCEEIDMSFKIRKLGYRCLVVPHTGIIHHGHHGVSAKSTVIKYFENQINSKELDKINKLYFLNKWHPKYSKK
jgi:GT2 family glycosyltransferase